MSFFYLFDNLSQNDLFYWLAIYIAAQEQDDVTMFYLMLFKHIAIQRKGRGCYVNTFYGLLLSNDLFYIVQV